MFPHVTQRSVTSAARKLIEDAISSKDHAALFSHLEKFSGEKGLVDQAFRELGIQQVVGLICKLIFHVSQWLTFVVSQSTEIESPVEPLLSLSVECAEKGLCSIHLPVTLLSDILDCLTLDRCEKLFSWVEARVHFWQKDFFFNTCKNRILRTCNGKFLLARITWYSTVTVILQIYSGDCPAPRTLSSVVVPWSSSLRSSLSLSDPVRLPSLL
ncbi:THOC1 [Cordylochernes scorpioides]|uniref:THOC1 n=1 Tax=Cordylochernes scorpioides TaxID=51811 RepID=A0ABY6L7Y4_9ARAC|nr:THOC1 [Cordylochernes scorpioides]